VIDSELLTTVDDSKTDGCKLKAGSPMIAGLRAAMKIRQSARHA
jgi:hypothetical protein